MDMSTFAAPQTFGTSDFDLERAKIERRRKLAEAMLADSMSPIGGTEMVGGVAVRKSPFEGLAKLAKAYVGHTQQKQADDELKTLGEDRRRQVADALNDYQTATTPRPATEPVRPVFENDDEGNAFPTIPGQAAYTPSAGDRQSAALKLLTSSGGDPRDVAKMVVAQAMKPTELKAFKPGDVLYQDGSRVGEIPKPQEPFTLSPGATRYGADNKPVVSAPQADPEAIRTVKAALAAAGIQEGTPQYAAAMRGLAVKSTTHQPPASTSVRVENKMGESIAGQVGPLVTSSFQNASGALSQVDAANRILAATEKGDVIAGPAANLRTRAAQIGQMLGVTGKDAAEQLANTRATIRGLAEFSLGARKALQGQGQITEKEQELLTKAVSANIDDLTVSEIRDITKLTKRAAEAQVRAHGDTLKRLRANPNTSGLADFFELPQQPTGFKVLGVEGK